MQSCLGCKTWFQQGSKLPLEDLLIQLKNYSYPIKDSKHKWILLKTIVSFLNSKGGTIYIGVDDSSGQVRGIDITRKQQDEYKLFIQRLAEKIQPTVDLTNRQDMKMHFLPVLKQGTFTGRFVAKIIVNQGELSKLYCFTQRVVLQNSNDKKYDDFDVLYSYKRINMGSVKELSGYQVVSEAAYRALNPPKLANTFHEGCNPDPKDTFSTGQQSPVQKQLQTASIPESTLEQQVQQGLLIHFLSLKNRQSRLKLEDILNKIMDKLQIVQYNISFEDQNNALIAEFALQSQWTHAIDYIDVNIDEINGEMSGKAKFGKKEHEDDYAIYENERPELGVKELTGEVNQVGSIDKKNTYEEPVLKHHSESLEEQISQQSQNSKQNQSEYKINIVEASKVQNSATQQNTYIKLPSTIDISKSEKLTITHINPSKKQQLIQYINTISNVQKQIIQYEKTIEIIFQNQQNFINLQQKLQKSNDINKFGFQGILRFGINTGQITLTNYNKNKYRQFKQYINKIVGQDIKRCQFNKNNNKFTLVLTLITPQKAAIWLDKLIQDKDIKQFRIPKPKVDQKMKIDLVCVKSNPQINQ